MLLEYRFLLTLGLCAMTELDRTECFQAVEAAEKQHGPTLVTRTIRADLMYFAKRAADRSLERVG